MDVTPLIGLGLVVLLMLGLIWLDNADKRDERRDARRRNRR